MNFYRQAETILDKLSRHEGTIKSLTLGDNSVKDKRRMYALICETLKCRESPRIFGFRVRYYALESDVYVLIDR